MDYTQDLMKATTKAKSIIDDLGLGGTFPLPIGIHKEQMIGIINPFEVDIKQVKDI